jgi:glycosyltransferase involved in cell wall biosynthesis
LNKASLLVFSSTWAAQSAIEDYHVDERKIHCFPFGANFEEIPPKEVALAKKKSEHCKLLFVGVNWRGKGGEIAFDTLVKLEELGIQAELIVCGCIPPNTFSHKRMRVIPFLDKNDEQQRKELEKLYATSDFLLLPTRYDCTPMVFCEANAFGLPVITAHTGGVPEVVKSGENGFVLPYDAGGDRYAEVIARIYRDDQRYSELVRSSRSAFEERLNWDAWGISMKRTIVEQLTAGRSRAETPPSNETVVLSKYR